jgi:hypothetical protein
MVPESSSPHTVSPDEPEAGIQKTSSYKPQEDSYPQPDKEHSGKILKPNLDFCIIPECIRNGCCTEGNHHAPDGSSAEKDGSEEEKGERSKVRDRINELR